MEELLSTGLLMEILNHQIPSEAEPVFQVLEIQKLQMADGELRYRATLSDGMYKTQRALFAAVISSKISEGYIDRFSFIKVTDFLVHETSEGYILVVKSLTVLGKGMWLGLKAIGCPEYPTTGCTDTLLRYVTISALHRSLRCIAIKALITKPPEISYKGTSSWFKVTLTDANGRIFFKAFNEHVDRFKSVLKENRVYEFSKFRIIEADPTYPRINKYEIHATNNTEYRECSEQESREIQASTANVTAIEVVKNLPIGSCISVRGCCHHIAKLTTKRRHDGSTFSRREITLIGNDDSKISIILWNENAELCTGKEKMIVLCKNATVSEYNDAKFLNTTYRSSILYWNE